MFGLILLPMLQCKLNNLLFHAVILICWQSDIMLHTLNNLLTEQYYLNNYYKVCNLL